MNQFFWGRNGFDPLSGVLLGGALVMSIVARFFPRAIFLPVIGMVLVAVAFWRIMSTKVTLRRAENERFLDLVDRLRRGPSAMGYRYFKCPACGQKVRVPRGKGRIAITCPSCNAAFIEKT